MTKTRKRWDPKEKFQIVLELLQGRKTQAEITSEY
jgi:transposase-like protein